MSIWERLRASLGRAPDSREKPEELNARREVQQDMLETLTRHCAAAGERTLAYRTEWQGYPPNPLTHWVEVAGKTVTDDFPRGWQQDDLDALVLAGALRRVGERVSPDDSYDMTVTYELTEPVDASP